MNCSLVHIDTACVLITINGFKILTDPTLDQAGKWYYHGSGGFSKKTHNPALPIDCLNDVDLVLLSHHQHKDNFDTAGEKLTLTVPMVISTGAAARAIKGITGISTWERIHIRTHKVSGLTVTATPAQHHPWWVPHFLAGDVIGFLIEFDGQKHGAMYISGDTVYYKGIQEVARRYRVDIAILHVGSVQFRYLTGFGNYTMNGKGLIQAVQDLRPNKVIPIHHKGWTHFKETETRLRKVIASDPFTAQRTVFLESGLAIPF